MRFTRAALSDLLLLASIAAVLGLFGGGPYYHPDHMLDEALHALQHRGDPGAFRKPCLLVYLQAGLYGALFLFLRAGGWVGSFVEFAEGIDHDRLLMIGSTSIPFDLPGHLLTLFFSILGVSCAYAMAYRLTNDRLAGLSAGLLLSTALMWVAQSHFLTVDIPLASLCIAASLLALELTETRAALSHPQLLLLGACAGLAAAMKYNGVLVLASALSPMVPCYPGDARRFSAAAGVLLVAAAATFFLVNPFLLIRPVAAAKDFYYELLHARVGHFGHETDNAWFFHATHSLSNGYGAGGLALAIAGLLWLWKTRDVSTTSKIAATAFPLVFYLMMGRSRLAFQRYVLPVLPFLAVYTALGARAAVHSLIVVLRAVPMQRQLAAYGALAIVLTVVLVNLKASLTHDLLLSRTDTRSDLIDVFRDVNLGDAVRLYSGIHTMAPLISARVLRREQFQRGLRPDLADNEASIIVLNSFDHDALLYDVRSRYPEPYYELTSSHKSVLDTEIEI
jgi:hypothetical protein